jgi:glycosidase
VAGDERERCTTQPKDGGASDPILDECHDVDFGYVDAEAESVWVSGTFTNWGASLAAGAVAMQKEGSLWRTTVTIEDPGPHLYKFIVNEDQWIPDPANPVVQDDGLGSFNSVVEVCPTGGGGDVDPPLPVGTCQGPSQWDDATFYFALVDRFYDGDGQVDPVPGASEGDARTGSSGQYEGGDLLGMTQKISYLADLGIEGLWLSAPYENRDSAGGAIEVNSDGHAYSAYHGYWPSPEDIDFSDAQNPQPIPRVESRLGSAQDLQNLVDGLHDQGMKIVFDYVMNHVDIDSGLYAAHGDWFARRDGQIPLCAPDNLWDDPIWGTRCAFTAYLPAFDFENPEARAWSVSDALWWARTFNIDGFRLDAIKHVPRIWLTDLRTRLNADIADPTEGRFYLVGETYDWENREAIKAPIDPATGLDGQFDFPHRARLCEAVFRPEGRLDAFSTWLEDNDAFYPADALMMNWIGNHDIPRAIHYASGQIDNCREGSHGGNAWTTSFSQPTEAEPYERLSIAFAILLTQPGLPLIYYGDEIGLAGGGDPDNRRLMPWEESSLNEHQIALRGKVRALARLRQQERVFSRGVRWTRFVDQDTWVYTMTGCTDSPDFTVVINRGDALRTLPLPPATLEDAESLEAVEGDVLEVGPRSLRVLRHLD